MEERTFFEEWRKEMKNRPIIEAMLINLNNEFVEYDPGHSYERMNCLEQIARCCMILSYDEIAHTNALLTDIKQLLAKPTGDEGVG